MKAGLQQFAVMETMMLAKVGSHLGNSLGICTASRAFQKLTYQATMYVKQITLKKF
jgi:hypothetical protein